MSTGRAGLVGVSFGLLVALGLAALLGGGGGPGTNKTPHTVTISVIAPGECSIDPGPVTGLKSGVGDYVIWHEKDGKPFKVTFPKGNTNFDTGSPFVNPLGNGWQTIFPSRDGKDIETGEAKLNLWPKSEFYIDTITVEDLPCYNRSNKPIEGMKVIIDR